MRKKGRGGGGEEISSSLSALTTAFIKSSGDAKLFQMHPNSWALQHVSCLPTIVMMGREKGEERGREIQPFSLRLKHLNKCNGGSCELE